MNRAGWDDYIRTFHEQRPGITEAVLARCSRDGHTPYEWLVEGLDTRDPVVDVACGSGPTRHAGGPGWVGIDASERELRAAGLAATGRAACGDARSLPLRTGAAAHIVCSMALMLIDPVADALREIRRVLDPRGTLRVLLPSTAGLTLNDRRRYTALAVRLRSPTMWPPSPLHHRARKELESVGFTLVADHHARFTYPIHSADDARLLLQSLYLPGVDPARVERSAGALWPGHSTEIAIGLRRTLAIGDQPREPPQAG